MTVLMGLEFLSGLPGQSGQPDTRSSQPGILNLRDWDPDRDGPARLTGKWQFRWQLPDQSANGKILTTSDAAQSKDTFVFAPPHMWNESPEGAGMNAEHITGTGIYSIQLDLPAPGKSTMNQPLAIHLERQMLTFRLFIDGELAAVSGNGRLETSPTPRSSDAIAFLPVGKNQVHLRLEITNLDHFSGGFRQPLTLDYATNIADRYDARHITALLTAAICFAVSLFAILMTGTGRHMKEYIWLALFAALVSFRIALNNNMFGDIFPALSVSMALRLNFLAQFLLAIAYLAYHHALFPAYTFIDRLPSWLQPWHLLRGMMWVAVAFSLVMPMHHVSQLREPFMILTTLGFVYLVFMLAKAARDGRRSAGLLLMMTLLLVAGFMHDALLTTGTLSGREWFALSFLGFILGQAFILAGRSTHAFRQVGELRDALFDLNQDLETRIVDRTKELEDARQAADSGNQAKSRFLATISHEIRTPMNGVTGVLDLLQRSSLQKEQQELVSMATESANSLLTLINDVLDFSKIEAGKLDLEILDAPLLPIMESAAALMAPAAQNKGLSVITDIQPGLELCIFTDPTRLRQILLNLLGNAIKFTDHGQVILKARQDPDGPDKRLLIEVLDTGMGLDDDTRDRLFEPFEQADDSTTRRFGGTGLGLSISHTLAELLGGEIGGENRAVGGSRFWLYLPARFTPLDIDRQAPDLSGKNAGLTISDNALHSAISHRLHHLGAGCADVTSIVDASSCDFRLIYCHDDLGRLVLPDPVSLAAENVILLVNANDLDAAALTGVAAPVVSLPYSVTILEQAMAFASGAAQAQKQTSPDTKIAPPVRAVPDFAQALKDGTAILVADDNAVNRRLVRLQLNQLGYACEMVPDGNTALAFLEENPVALLLTDYHMPGMNGVKLTRAIRSRESRLDLPRLPVIGLTAAAMQEEVMFLQENGMDAVLTKPVDLSRLADLLHGCLPLPENVEHNDTLTSTATPPTARGQAGETTDLLDFSVLDAFFGDDIPAMKDMVLSFLNNNRESLGLMYEALKQQDRKAMFHAAHSIHGSSASIGMRAIGTHAAMMNDLADAEQHDHYLWDTAAHHVKQLEDLITITGNLVSNLGTAGQ